MSGRVKPSAQIAVFVKDSAHLIQYSTFFLKLCVQKLTLNYGQVFMKVKFSAQEVNYPGNYVDLINTCRIGLYLQGLCFRFNSLVTN